MEQSMNRYIGQMLDDRYEILEIIGPIWRDESRIGQVLRSGKTIYTFFTYL